MRSKVRGLRTVEREILSTRATTPPHATEDVAAASPGEAPRESPAFLPPASAVVLDYCTVVKGILNDDQGGPLHPPGLRMAEALESVWQSVERNLRAKKGGPQNAS
jgi:hypothetical protein